MHLSVTIITLNEEKSLARAIKSVEFADEVIVVDSFSDDKTVEIAKSLGAKVFQNEFQGYGQQKNYAASKASHQWILNIDADEEVSIEMSKRILEIIKADQSYDVYSVNRLTKYIDHWVRYCGWYPQFIKRLYKKDKAKWSQPNVHEDIIPNKGSKVGKIHEHLFHYSFPSIESQVHVNLKYSKLAAKDLIERNKSIGFFTLFFKPWWKFFECYILKKGFLDGKTGFIIAFNSMHAMFLKYAIANINKKGSSK